MRQNNRNKPHNLIINSNSNITGETDCGKLVTQLKDILSKMSKINYAALCVYNQSVQAGVDYAKEHIKDTAMVAGLMLYELKRYECKNTGRLTEEYQEWRTKTDNINFGLKWYEVVPDREPAPVKYVSPENLAIEFAEIGIDNANKLFDELTLATRSEPDPHTYPQADLLLREPSCIGVHFVRKKINHAALNRVIDTSRHITILEEKIQVLTVVEYTKLYLPVSELKFVSEITEYIKNNSGSIQDD